MDEQLKKNLTDQSLWIRAAYMVLYYVIFHLVEALIICLALIQLVLALFTGKPNENLVTLGKSLAEYLREITSFVSFASNQKPYPFSPWPKA